LAGYYGDETFWTDGSNSVKQGNLQSTCTGKCAAGHYCLAGSINSTANACPAGTFGDALGLSTKACSGNCIKGHYCPKGSICKWGQTEGDPSTCVEGDGGAKKCKAGHYGPGGSQTDECFGQCLEGHWCGVGSFQSDQVLRLRLPMRLFVEHTNLKCSFSWTKPKQKKTTTQTIRLKLTQNKRG
jgi:hypothetical protein